MNKTQKAALFGLVIFAASALVGALFVIEVFFLKAAYSQIHVWSIIFLLTVFVLGLFFILKKQSKNEVESDERDKLIQMRAVVAAFVAVLIAIAAVIVGCTMVIGIQGKISVWVMTLLNMAAILIAFTAYFVATLIQYMMGTNDEQS